MERGWKPNADQISPACPRCGSTNTKFCYYNNYSLTQPRYFCKSCRRYWTKGGSLRNVPVGGGCRKSRRGKSTRANTEGIGATSRSSGHVSRVDSSSSFSAGPSHTIDLAKVYANFLNQTPRNEGGVVLPDQLPPDGITNMNIPLAEFPSLHVNNFNCDYHILECRNFPDMLSESTNQFFGDGNGMSYCFNSSTVNPMLNNAAVLAPLPGEVVAAPHGGILWPCSDVTLPNNMLQSTGIEVPGPVVQPHVGDQISELLSGNVSPLGPLNLDLEEMFRS